MNQLGIKKNQNDINIEFIAGFPRPDTGFDSIDRLDDDWRHVDTVSYSVFGY